MLVRVAVGRQSRGSNYVNNKPLAKAVIAVSVFPKKTNARVSTRPALPRSDAD